MPTASPSASPSASPYALPTTAPSASRPNSARLFVLVGKRAGVSGLGDVAACTTSRHLRLRGVEWRAQLRILESPQLHAAVDPKRRLSWSVLEATQGAAEARLRVLLRDAGFSAYQLRRARKVVRELR